MRDLVFAITLFASNLFFCISAIFGYSVAEEGGASGLYKYYCIGVFIISLLFCIKEQAKRVIRYRHFWSILIIAIYIIIGVLSGYNADTSVLVLIAFCLPSVVIAVYYAERRSLSELIKWIDIILLVMSLSLVFSLRQLFVSIADGISSYSQSLSYNAAYCFVLYLFLLIFGKNYERFSFFKSKLYKYISIIMLPYTLVILFFSGGRGAFGTLVVGCIVLFILYRRQNNSKQPKYLKLLFETVLVLSLVFTLIPRSYKDVFNTNFDRVFSFFDTDKSMFERASGRDEVLSIAFEQIRERPILGSGLFSYKKELNKKAEVSYPHNIFIEVLMQGGIVFLLFFLIIILQATIKLKCIFRVPQQELLVVFIVYSMTMLLYSGSYMQNSFFWFFMTYIFNFNKKIAKK